MRVLNRGLEKAVRGTPTGWSLQGLPLLGKVALHSGALLLVASVKLLSVGERNFVAFALR